MNILNITELICLKMVKSTFYVICVLSQLKIKEENQVSASKKFRDVTVLSLCSKLSAKKSTKRSSKKVYHGLWSSREALWKLWFLT